MILSIVYEKFKAYLTWYVDVIVNELTNDVSENLVVGSGLF